MKFKAKKSIIITIVTALIAVALGICAVVFSTKSNDHGDFNGTYRLTAFADGKASYSKINVFGREVDVSSTISIASNDGNYTLYLSVIDLGDLVSTEELPVPDFNIGYKFGVGEYFTGNNQSGLSNVVYSSLTSGDSTLNVTDLGLDENMFSNPYFVIVELPSSTQLNGSANVILAEKHTLEAVEGQSATCSADGWNSYYKCTDEGCTKFFADSVGETEISDLEAWKLGDGKIEALPHTVVTDEAVAPNCTEEGLTQGSHCSVCGKTLVAQQTVNALGHTEVTDDAVSATCTKTGLTEGKHCSECGEILVAQQTVEALGHNYVNHICSRCGDLEKVADENGVYYQLTANSDASGYHFVVCGKADNFDTKYYTSGNTLILKNEIDGYSVTEIGYEALANYVLNENGERVTGTTETSIKNVIIPAKIVTIGERTFLNNIDMESAIFLAETVNVAGSFDEGEGGNTTPFFGCYKSSDKEKTALSVYFNTVIYENSSTNLRWTRFNRTGSGAVWHRYYIGCDPRDTAIIDYDHKGDGTLYSNSLSGYANWYYYDYETVGAKLLDGITFNELTFAQVVEGKLTKGLTTTEINLGTVQSELTEMLNSYTSTNLSCIDKYSVSVTQTVNAFGTSVITVKVENGATMYPISASSQVGGTIDISGNTKEYNGKTYANGDVTVTVSEYNEACTIIAWKNAINGNSLPFNENGSITIEVTEAISLIAVFDTEFKTVTVVSVPSFTYGGDEPTSTETANTYTISVAVKNGTPLEAEMKAEGYLFLGWAIDNGSSLEFTSMTANEEVTYYAIWASDSNLTSATQTTSGTLENVSVTVTDGTFYGWYADAEFTTPISTISVENTVLYARRQFTVKAVFTFQNTALYERYSDTGTETKIFVSTKSDTTETTESTINRTILEGQNIIIKIYESGRYCDVSFGDLTVRYRGHKKGKTDNYNNRRTFKDADGNEITSDTILLNTNASSNIVHNFYF